MSRITKALEKAARERLIGPKVTVTAPAVEMAAKELTSSGLDAAEVTCRIDPHIVTATDPKSPIAEQYRILRTNLQSLRLKPGAKTFMITSALNGEGKTVTAINLALAFARQENLRVALIDADMRKSSLPSWFGIDRNHQGLAEVLSQGGTPNGALRRLSSIPLTVLPAGSEPEQPSELLESSAMKRLLATLKSEFDVILIDTPPVLLVTDPAVIASQVDGVILVVKGGSTQLKTVLKARNLLDQAKANILGTVLTHAEYYIPGYSGYYRYRYGASKTKDANGKSVDQSAAVVAAGN